MTLERVRAGLDALFGDAGGSHDEEDARAVIRLVGAAVEDGPLRSNPEAVHSLVVHLVGDGRISRGAYIRNGAGTFDWHPTPEYTNEVESASGPHTQTHTDPGNDHV